ncbi:MAG: nuclear transport factor 2 family protein, partial [Caulobacteraceae bacterium]
MAAVFTGPAAFAGPSEDMAATERQFALDARTTGGLAAFKRYVAPDAVTFDFDPATKRPKVVNAKAKLESRPDTGKLAQIVWGPSFTGMSLSGDFGYTSGPLASLDGKRFGYIFSVWRKQADGSWKWYFDGGPPLNQKPAETLEAPVSHLPMAAAKGSPEAAVAQVKAIEGKIARASKASTSASLAPYLASDARALGSGGPLATDARGRAAELAAREQKADLTLMDAVSAPSGDLVLTYGEWLKPGTEELLGGYARIWQKRSSGWKIVYDQVLAAPPPPP